MLAYSAHLECKIHPVSLSGALNEYFLYRFKLYLLLFACSGAKPWLSLVNICPPISSHLLCMALSHRAYKRGSSIHLFITNTVFVDCISAPFPNIHSFQSIEIWRVRWMKQTFFFFFPFEEEVKYICIWNAVCLITMNRIVLSGFGVSLMARVFYKTRVRVILY